jgi:hypothetical protein
MYCGKALVDIANITAVASSRKVMNKDSLIMVTHNIELFKFCEAMYTCNTPSRIAELCSRQRTLCHPQVITPWVCAIEILV